MLKVTNLSFTAAALSLMTASTSSTVSAVESSDCTLDCQNNGTCVKQWQTAARSSSNFIQVMACSCPEGFTGPLCEQDASTQNEEESSCTLNCVNGGQCLWEWTSTDSGNYAFEKQMKCDCTEGFGGELCEESSTANNNNSTNTEMECTKDCGANGECMIEWTSVARSSHQFTSNEVCQCDEGFEGDQCQYEKQASPETPCAHTCHNGGKCVSKWETAPLANDAMIQVTGCECAPGFTGPSCEIEVSDDDEDDKCHLDCLNGGQCVFTWMETGTHNTNYFNSVYLSSFMMCECPLGYMGLHCEYQVETCPDSTMCFNGGKCVQDTASDSYSCDCSDTPNEGSMCEQESKKQVEVCDYGHVGHGQSLFCVNGGTCDTAVSQKDSDTTYHHGCQCPDGFFGHHCEFHLEDTMMVARETTETTFSSSTASTPSSSSLNGVEITLIVVFSVAGTAFVMALLSIRVFVGQHDSKQAKKCESTSAVPTSVIGDLDADGSSTMKDSQTDASRTNDIQIV